MGYLVLSIFLIAHTGSFMCTKSHSVRIPRKLEERRKRSILSEIISRLQNLEKLEFAERFYWKVPRSHNSNNLTEFDAINRILLW